MPTDSGVIIGDEPDALALTTDVALRIDSSVATAVVDLVGQSASFVLQWARAWEGQPQPSNPSSVRHRLHDTLAAWSSWSAQHQRYDGPRRDLVRFGVAFLQGG